MIDLQTQKLIEDRVHELIEQVNKRFHVDLRDVQIKYKAMAPGGLANFTNNSYTITFQEDLTKTDLNKVLSIIAPHEVAHLACFWIGTHNGPKDYAHGALWKRIDLALGGTGKAKVDIPSKETSKKPYKYVATNGEEFYLPTRTHNLIQNQFRVYKTKKGGTITAASYQKPNS